MKLKALVLGVTVGFVCAQAVSCAGASTCVGSACDGGAGGGMAVVDAGSDAGAVGGGSGGSGGGSGGGAPISCNPALQDCPNGVPCTLNDPSGTARCFPGGCNTLTQDCPNSADKCTYLTTPDAGRTRGCTTAGSVGENGACTTNDNCAKGLLCVNLTGNALTCRKLCYRNQDCTAGSSCAGTVTYAGTSEIPLICIPLTMCDVLTQNCGAGQGCYLAGSNPICAPAGTVDGTNPCSGANLCVPGKTCLVAMQGDPTGTCFKYCNLDGGAPGCTTGRCASIGSAGVCN